MTLRFSIEYFTRWGENLFLRSGSRSWPMRWTGNGIWAVELDAEDFFGGRETVEYWHEVICDGLSTRHEWRLHRLGRPAGNGSVDIRVSWSDIPGWKGAGTAVPVFSLRSREDFGTGEFHDLLRLVDWAEATGQTVIQLLPVNDTTMTGGWEDSYPYNANSAFALHPQYIHLPDIGVEEDEEYLERRDRLNALPHVDCVEVNRLKKEYLHKAFEAGWASLSKTLSYRNFLDANRGWLIPYSVFCSLRDRYGTPVFGEWPELSAFDGGKVEKWASSHKREVGYHCFVQFHLDRQLRSVREYAHSKGIILKGDLPIGVSRTSVDAWQHPELFNMDSQAGAPPDAFSADGQNWGFPTYNWEEMERDGYSWWKARLGKMSEYFDAFRIDHILGFFRIWEIPIPHRSGLDGHFSPALPYSLEETRGYKIENFLEDPRKPGFFHPRIDAREELGELHEDFFFRRHNEFWKLGALGKLSAICGCTNMLPCGEDLGMIPACVPEVMERLHIASLEIQRMPKEYGRTFGDLSRYPYNCVCTTSTHDMNPLRAWWEEDRELTQKYFNEVLGLDGKAPAHCTPDICRLIVERHLESPAMLVILPLQDWLSIDGRIRYHGRPEDERINIPAICPHYWRYRLHLPLEDILNAEKLNAAIRNMVSSSCR